MSGYLNRLIKRTQVANKSKELRPFVRSTSPIAEHDQRLSVAGFEEAEQGVAPSADADTGLDWGQTADDPALTTSKMTGLSDITVQRKIAGSNTPTASRASTPSAASGLEASDMPSPTLGAERARPLGFSGGVPQEWLRESGASVQGDGSTASLSSPITGKSGSQPPSNQRDRPMGSAELQPPLHPPLTVSKTVSKTASKVPAIAIETNRMAGADPILGVPSWEMPSSNRPSVEEGEEINRLNDLRPEASLTRSQGTVPRLEPFTQRLDRDERWLDGSPASTIDRHETPQVVIGRITVEVISPMAIAATAAPSRLGPVTAASMSVIGPLGGGVSSHLRLSLRQR